MLEKLSEKEKEAIEILKKHGWQIVMGPHLEDWDEGQEIKSQGYVESEISVDIAIIKENIEGGK